jgi:hypothetical protein
MKAQSINIDAVECYKSAVGNPHRSIYTGPFQSDNDEFSESESG